MRVLLAVLAPLGEDMLSSCKCFHSPLVMEASWQLVPSINVLSVAGGNGTTYWDIHDVNFGVVQQLYHS